MESESENQHNTVPAHEALGVISADRGRIGEQMTAATWWAAPAQGLSAALFVGGPAAGLEWGILLILLALGILVGVGVLFRKRTGMDIRQPAGPRSSRLLVAFFLITCVMSLVSAALLALGMIGWIVAVAVAAGIAGTLLVVAYDRAYAAEVRHAN